MEFKNLEVDPLERIIKIKSELREIQGELEEYEKEVYQTKISSKIMILSKKTKV